MSWFKKILAYLLPVVSGAVTVAVSKKFGVEAGAVIGGAVATTGARVLHLADPPAKAPTP